MIFSFICRFFIIIVLQRIHIGLELLKTTIEDGKGNSGLGRENLYIKKQWKRTKEEYSGTWMPEGNRAESKPDHKMEEVTVLLASACGVKNTVTHSARNSRAAEGMTVEKLHDSKILQNGLTRVPENSSEPQLHRFKSLSPIMIADKSRKKKICTFVSR